MEHGLTFKPSFLLLSLLFRLISVLTEDVWDLLTDLDRVHQILAQVAKLDLFLPLDFLILLKIRVCESLRVLIVFLLQIAGAGRGAIIYEPFAPTERSFSTQLLLKLRIDSVGGRLFQNRFLLLQRVRAWAIILLHILLRGISQYMGLWSDRNLLFGLNA